MNAAETRAVNLIKEYHDDHWCVFIEYYKDHVEACFNGLRNSFEADEEELRMGISYGVHSAMKQVQEIVRNPLETNRLAKRGAYHKLFSDCLDQLLQIPPQDKQGRDVVGYYQTCVRQLQESLVPLLTHLTNAPARREIATYELQKRVEHVKYQALSEQEQRQQELDYIKNRLEQLRTRKGSTDDFPEIFKLVDAGMRMAFPSQHGWEQALIDCTHAIEAMRNYIWQNCLREVVQEAVKEVAADLGDTVKKEKEPKTVFCLPDWAENKISDYVTREYACLVGKRIWPEETEFKRIIPQT